MSILENGRETFDQTPVAYPLHFQRPTPLHIRIRNMILQQLAESKSYEEYDTAEEADDFEIDDDEFPTSPYEMEDDFDHLNDEKWKGGAGGETSPDMETSSNEGVPPNGDTTSEK